MKSKLRAKAARPSTASSGRGPKSASRGVDSEPPIRLGAPPPPSPCQARSQRREAWKANSRPAAPPSAAPSGPGPKSAARGVERNISVQLRAPRSGTGRTVGNITPETATEQGVLEIASGSSQSQPHQQPFQPILHRAAAKGDDRNSRAGLYSPHPPPETARKEGVVESAHILRPHIHRQTQTGTYI